MKFIAFTLPALLLAGAVQAQNPNKTIKLKEVTRIETTLASDAMQGRRSFTPGLQKASAFIEQEFKKIGLQEFPGSTNYRQEFVMYESVPVATTVTLDGVAIPAEQIAAISYQPEVSFTQQDSMEMVHIAAGDKFNQKFYEYYQSTKNLLVLVDSSFAKRITGFRGRKRIAANQASNTIVFVVTTANPSAFSVKLTNDIRKLPLNNVVGYLPGRSKPEEYVIFSGHYDHLGIGSPEEGMPHDQQDSIYNGANDDAAGITAVIMLAKHFKKANNNERSIIFAAFAAEEIGGYGSQHFSRQLAPEKVVAMINIEMIGTESKWGLNSAYLTGFEKSDMGTILQKNLAGTNFTFHPDPYPDQQLFYRSDNATLARLGVPAHTLSTSKMDSEPNYHKASDEVETLDLKNMTEIIKSIAKSAASIISGADTPSRVDTTQLR